MTSAYRQSVARYALRLPRGVVAAVGVATLLMAASSVQRGDIAPPQSDETYYIRLAMGLAEFGVFGNYVRRDKAPPPVGEAPPFYPFLLAGYASIDDQTQGFFRCVLEANDPDRCTVRPQLLLACQTALAVLALVCIWATGLLWSGRHDIAWLALLAAWLANALQDSTHFALTEAVVIPLFSVLTLAAAALTASARRHWRWALPLGGLALGLLTLTRPGYLHLLLFLASIAGLSLVMPATRTPLGKTTLAACIVALLVATPWMLRNKAEFGQFGISVGEYGGRAIAKRVSYNDMRHDELAAAFIYWLPDFGDSLAAATMPPESWQRLHFGPGSFYARGPELLAEAEIASGGPATAAGHLLRERVLGEPAKHVAVAAALAWRGMFVEKTWGLLAWICTVLVVLRLRGESRKRFLLLLIAPGFMVFFHAMTSVSIPRYNVGLLPNLSLALAVCLQASFHRLRSGRSR